MSINGSVTMTVGELDGLREQIKQGQLRVAELESNQRTMKIRTLKKEDREYWTNPKYGMPRRETEVIEVEAFVNMDDVVDPIKLYIRNEFENQLNRKQDDINELRRVKSEKDAKITGLETELRELRAKGDTKEVLKLEKELTEAKALTESIRKSYTDMTTKYNKAYKNWGLALVHIKNLNNRGFWARLFNRSVGTLNQEQ